MEAPLSLQLEVTAPPKTSIRTSGATVAVTAIVNVMVLPPGKPPVQLTSMTMVDTHTHTHTHTHRHTDRHTHTDAGTHTHTHTDTHYT